MLNNEFQPNWIYPPSKIVENFIVLNKVDTSTLHPEIQSVLHDLVNKNIAIDAHISKILEDTIGGTVQFWLNIQNQFTLNTLRIENSFVDSNFKDYKDLITELKKADWIPNSNYNYLDQVHLKTFFGISEFSILTKKYIIQHNLRIKFKNIGTYSSSELNIATLVRKAELEAKKQLISKQWDQALFLEKLQEIKKLSRIKKFNDFKLDLQNICNQCGVAFIVLDTLNKSPIRGISKFINNHTGLIIITTKYNQDDIFWQTFFHEVGHLVLHSKEMVFADQGNPTEKVTSEELETQADNFMISQILYPYTNKDVIGMFDKKLMYSAKEKSWRNICQISRQIDISPSLLTGILKLQGIIPYNYFTNGHNKIYD
ncbi:hypothetical protein [Acinetobacter sp.]|jgi:plasmid maintenance system antidote protein VapI/Zn-dependent peptidase ImmA (M78 family)|uniref:ImmA/IrrE family metallo-endopeptidase n=1 Tax=Acinetobacter sp. TaxID=472 RepID=UPI00283593D0|nr:hypothetical protein [Acinetobacter sp.]MDR0236518.1 hypothetical protein [Acinetobacter sp.]MDR2279164.1 hypothetical protein [Vagococcus sp.]